MNYKQLYIYLIVSVISLAFAFSNLIADETVDIHSVTYPNKKIINMGPCFINEKIYTEIFVQYNGDSSVYIRNQLPTIMVFKSGLDKSLTGREYQSFNADGNFPYRFDKNESVTIPFYYHAEPSVGVEEGWFHANVMVGVAYVGGEDTVRTDTFTLIAKKTPHYIDGFIDSLNFDSVYVNPMLPQKRYWKIKSTYVDNIETESISYKSLSPVTDEIEFGTKDYDILPVFPKRFQTFDWEIHYAPTNRGLDSCKYFIHYYPDKKNEPERTDSISLKVIGTGIKQELSLIKSNMKFSKTGDTIYVGNVPAGYRETITGELVNTGNIDFYSIGESVKKQQLNEASNIVAINKTAFIEKPLMIGDTTNFALDVKVDSLGIFIERYEIESNILSRNIHGVPHNEIKKTIYIRGEGSAPQLRLPTDSIDFGNVVINEVHCPSERHITIPVSNTGNSDLIVNKLAIVPNNKFKVDTHSFVLAPEQDTLITITFFASDGQFGKFESTLYFETKDFIQNKSVALRANGVPRKKSWLSINDTVTALPGEYLGIPIVIEDRDFNTHPISTAKNFITRLSFDSTVVNYINRNIIGTASEAATIGIREINGGQIEIEIDNGTDYFPPIDTLIILQMRAFLGNEASTPIAFQQGITKFGDGLCDDVINIEGNIFNGRLSLDSICGLPHLVHKRKNFNIEIKSISPNPADEFIDIIFDSNTDEEIKISVYNSEGDEILSNVITGVIKGTNSYRLSVRELNSQSYYLILDNNYFKDTMPFLIVQ